MNKLFRVSLIFCTLALLSCGTPIKGMYRDLTRGDYLNEMMEYLDEHNVLVEKEDRTQFDSIEAIRKEMNECIREFVDKLNENYRTVIILSELKDLKNQDIADILGISLDAVKIRLHRARVKLKELFEAGCEFYRNEDNELACDRKREEPEKNGG